MIWIDFNPQVGGEMRDEHPMLVLSTKAFNERTGIVIGLPMTHAASNESNPFAVKYVGPKGEAGYVLTHQPKSIDDLVDQVVTKTLDRLGVRVELIRRWKTPPAK